ncbi:hypothetical protein SAY86_024685 [Trapa natans]|uniref:NAC domain-containing protein n=1 Tax=Trapa natans TaxID=22666 RepID=A0AAN7M4S4_TRANT|nr:hypothetical protein SAY86_024685 [Trapa natans]
MIHGTSQVRRRVSSSYLPCFFNGCLSNPSKFHFFICVELAMTREKEWYFYCPRGRKYRNSVRPNRVTGAGFWKATGMDRPIYSSEGTTGKCIGLKKSLVFYRGRAAKGFKTDWMMHEFRLPPVTPGSNLTNNKLFDRNSIPPNDSWAICRIFKKAASMAQQRALSHHRPQFPPQAGSDSPELGALFSSKNTSCPTHIGSAVQLADHGCNNSLQNSSTNFSTMEDHSYRSDAPSASQSSHLQVPNGEALNNFILGPTMLSDINRASGGMYSQGPLQFTGGFSVGLVSHLEQSMDTAMGGDQMDIRRNLVRAQISSHCVNPPRTMSFPFTHQSDTLWASPPCPSHISASFSTNKCYT